MSVNVKVRLKENVEPEKIVNFLKEKYGGITRMDVKTTDYTEYKITSGYIFVSDICIFYYRPSINLYENYDYWVKKGLRDMVETHTTNLTAYCDERNKKVMYEVVKEFGGWIDYNDSDEEYYEPVVKKPDGSIKPVIYVTMEEINEKFGGIVIIKDNKK